MDGARQQRCAVHVLVIALVDAGSVRVRGRAVVPVAPASRPLNLSTLTTSNPSAELGAVPLPVGPSGRRADRVDVGAAR